jgi:hypothetical protein
MIFLKCRVSRDYQYVYHVQSRQMVHELQTALSKPPCVPTVALGIECIRDHLNRDVITSHSVSLPKFKVLLCLCDLLKDRKPNVASKLSKSDCIPFVLMKLKLDFTGYNPVFRYSVSVQSVICEVLSNA